MLNAYVKVFLAQLIGRKQLCFNIKTTFYCDQKTGFLYLWPATSSSTLPFTPAKTIQPSKAVALAPPENWDKVAVQVEAYRPSSYGESNDAKLLHAYWNLSGYLLRDHLHRLACCRPIWQTKPAKTQRPRMPLLLRIYKRQKQKIKWFTGKPTKFYLWKSITSNQSGYWSAYLLSSWFQGGWLQAS